LIRDPVSVYAAKSRRMRLNTQAFCHWYNQVSTFKFTDQEKILTIYYHDLLSDVQAVIEEISSFISADIKDINLSGGFEPPDHYKKYVGTRIDASREQYLQSLVSDEDRIIIRDNCIFNPY